MIYAMSDIHGCARELRARLEQITLTGKDTLVFLGDYIDYGPSSGEVLRLIMDLQNKYGNARVIALKGNHEDMFLSWLRDHRRKSNWKIGKYNNGKGNCTDTEGRTREKGGIKSVEEARFHNEDMAEALPFTDDSWFLNDRENGYWVFKTLVKQETYLRFRLYARSASIQDASHMAAAMIENENRELLAWMRSLPLYYETKTWIFVHAGVEEAAEDLWKTGTPDEMFMWKYPPSTGAFCKTVIAGHVGTYSIAREPTFHDVYYDGASHYYIDGTVYNGGNLCLLSCDEETGICHSL